ncbi:hypothetical protein CDD83_5274 [Cordyceps sp. RAO-2017]|nr:hypothetical protein CDD83_5274 [Cordyceps sp. RAO-2017]
MKPRRKRTWTSKRRKQHQQAEEGWYSIRGILDEREASGRVDYLVDWDDNIDTGESYDPTWVCSREVTDEARQEWETAKAARAQKDEAREESADDSDDSQPPRPANRRQFRRANAKPLTRPRSSTADTNPRPSKAPRLGYSATPSEEPVPSIISGASLDSVEPFDLPAQDNASEHRQAPNLVIEFGKDSQLDLGEYFSVTDTQSSLKSSKSLAELEDRDERLALASQISRQTVPDSQELSGPTWSQCRIPSLSTGQQPSTVNTGHPHASATPESQSVDIPSRQPVHSDSPGVRGQQGLRTAQDAPRSGSSRSNTAPDSVRRNSGGRSTATASPAVFLTQPPALCTFGVPESSSRSRKSVSSIGSRVKATASDRSQPSPASCSHTVQASTEAQDAQVAASGSFRSQVDLFSGSDNAERVPPSRSSHSAAACRQRESTSPKESRQDRPADRGMEAHDTDERAHPASRPSVADELCQLFNLDNSIAGPSSTSSALAQSQNAQALPPVPTAQSQAPAVQSMRSLVDAAFNNSNDVSAGTLMPDDGHLAQQVTVSPAEVSKQTESERTLQHMIPSIPSLPSQVLETPSLFDSSQGPPQMAQVPCEQASADSSSEASADLGQREYVVTLPFQASLRPLYDETLLESKRAVTDFGRIFNNEIYVEPEESLACKIDQLFQRLFNICDYPQDTVGTALEQLSPPQLAKYCCDANPKFSFVFELLQGLQRDIRILVVARSVELLRLLSHLTETLEIEYICDAVGLHKSKFTISAARVTLALPDEDPNGADFDLVIGFDHSFATSRVMTRLASSAEAAKKPLLLTLVTTHSIEHIDLHVPVELGPMEHKNALLSGIARARKLVSDPDRGYPEPHELACFFVEYLNGETDTVMWESAPLPDDVLDIFMSSQAQTQIPELAGRGTEDGRKRKLGDSADEQAKKMRILSMSGPAAREQEPPLPDDVRAMLQGATAATTSTSSETQVKVPLAALQALAENLAEQEREIAAKDNSPYVATISGLEKRVKEYERTLDKIYQSHRKALEDRTLFESQKQASDAALSAATESAKRDNEKAQRRIAELEAAVARLTANPDGSEDETPLAKTDRLLKEAQERTQILEKRLENAHNDGEYVRNLYQDATSSASALRAEVTELKEQNEELRKKTSDGPAKVQKIQAENSAREFVRSIRGLKAQVKERELELDRVREELRQLRNGRRETRQVSVPRSPRMGMMSPRTGRGFGSSASRGTSPAPAPSSDGAAPPPGMPFMSGQQPGNGRWNHLRD